MQYILSDEEDNVFSDEEYKELSCHTVRIDKVKLQNICTLVARHVPIKNKKPCGYILDKNGPSYCDGCKAIDACQSHRKIISK